MTVDLAALARMIVNLAALSLFASGAGWLACLLAAFQGWHAFITAPCASVLVAPMVACAVWLHRAAGDDGRQE